MIRQHKKMLVFTSIVTLLPIVIGLLLWKQLPDSVATHFGADNQPNGYSSKVFAVFGLPFILLMIHFICVVVTNIDPKEKNISKKVFQVVLWICPLVSLVVCNMIYVYNLGYQLNTGVIGGVLIGALYLILGNFIPKIKPNYSIGFRVPWALCDSENWYHTHRFGGKCMVIGGIVLIATSPFQNVWILLVLAIIPCILPVIYSYLYYRKVID
ncbi:SdpI family protein [uncultured Eubacterium sp.]|uniref:SdpI family protein n=1 Tax=uncultured Eubacterium sp. TaxID=165185 RepID=UPI0025E45540|nr:SdpI family protein [uncultured Eubacterium sp.]MCI6537379.1 SdpI family protein [Lachnospiraceae bacterium]